MSFHNDPARQLDAIRSNIDRCPQTPAAERAALHAVVDQTLASTVNSAIEPGHVNHVMNALGEKASAENLFFKGMAKAIDRLAWHTKREDKMIRAIELALRDSDPELSAAERRDAADTLLLNLSQTDSFEDAVRVAGAFALHWHSRPLWTAVPGDETPPIETDVEYLPARLGLIPDDATPTRYVLALLELEEGFVPRFADSQGYAYWRPGGLTEPIEECPDGYTGLTELVVDNVCIRDISRPLQNFLRMF